MSRRVHPGPKGKPNDDKAAASRKLWELTEVNFIIDLNFRSSGNVPSNV